MRLYTYNQFLSEGWLSTNREVVLPRPTGHVNWEKAKGKVTPDTIELLEKLQPEFHNVSLFSWHPKIHQAQYSDSYHRGDHDSNYNTRSLIDGSIICLGIGNFNTVSRAVDSFPYMKTMGGSGNTQDGKKSLLMQISFLKGDYTHEEAQKLKQEKLTAGAYTYDGKEWMYIPADKFDTTHLVYDQLRSTMDTIREFFDHVLGVSNINERLRKDFFNGEGSMTIKFEEEWQTKPISLTFKLKGGDSTAIVYSQRTPEDKWWEKTCPSPVDFFHRLLERNPHMFTSEEKTVVSQDTFDVRKFVEDYAHRRRGHKTAKDYGV